MNEREELKIALFASGKGSNFAAILRGIDDGSIPRARIALVISDNPGAGALQVARDRAIPAVHIDRRLFASGKEFARALKSLLNEHRVNFIVLAGYLKKVDDSIIDEYENRIINIHPALLPAFGGKGMYGMKVHEAVIATGQTVSGATVHFVDKEYDHGAIILQRSVPVTSEDTPQSLAAKVQTIEHGLYPEVLRLFAEGRVQISNGKVRIPGTP